MNNQTVLITGASTGIGLEFAKIFYSKGYNLVLVSRNEEKLKIVKESLLQGNVQSINLIPCDLSLGESAQRVHEECISKELQVQILINNAGFGIYGEHVSLPISEVENMISLNVMALTTLCTLFGRDMKKRESGYILNVASTGAYQPVPYHAVYAATKSYVLNFSEALAKEMEEFNVHVTCLSPGATNTDFFLRSGVGNVTSGWFAMKRRMDASIVAEQGVSALFDHKLSTITGFTNRVSAISNRFIPRWIMLSITKFLMRKSGETDL
ncbi:MAG: SDR family NAD(P)-dependent oxidoreductase [Fidelibacterota bacterium]